MKAKAAKASWRSWAKPETKLCFVNYQKLLPPVHITNKVLITVVIECEFIHGWSYFFEQVIKAYRYTKHNLTS